MGDLQLSVVMPAHRADSYLRAAIQSVEHAIAHHDAELIVIANGEAKSQVEAMVRECRTSPSTKVVSTALRSLVHCLNLGIETATGEWVARFDADDLCTPDRFDTQLRIAERSGADFLFGGANVIDKDGKAAGERRVSKLPLWRTCDLIHPTAFMRRSTLLKLGGYGNLEFSEDYHLWLRASARGFRFSLDTAPVIEYRVHGEQSTSRDKLADTFATNAGIKIAAGLRYGRPVYLLGATIDGLLFLYCKLRSWLR